MKNFVMIELVTHNSFSPYYAITDAKRNKQWIIQYNTTLIEMIHYAQGYTEALDIDLNIYFKGIPADELNAISDFLPLNLLTEQQFKDKQALC